MKVLVTGSAGFIGGYVVSNLLQQGHEVVGIDNYSKYGPIKKSYDQHSRYKFHLGDAKDTKLISELLTDCDHFIAAAALVGGISYFHQYPFDIMAENERLTASAFEAAIKAHQKQKLKKITLISSSMVFERSQNFPHKEGDQNNTLPPLSSYGFQKLATEYFARAAFEQYQLPYTILRPFNCVGIGEVPHIPRESKLRSNEKKLVMSHVIPDLIQKALLSTEKLDVLGNGQQIRHFTHGSDLAKGVVLSLENPNSLNEDFNLSTNEATQISDLAELIWSKIHPDKKFQINYMPGFVHDVQTRTPDTSKAKKLLSFEATIPLNKTLDEVITWSKNHLIN